VEISEKGLQLVKNFEGCRLTAYFDAVGVLTIGWGHTGVDVTPGKTITQEQAEEMLLSDLGRFERGVETAVVVGITQGQFDALVSFAYNLGLGALRESTLLRKLNMGDYIGAADEFGKWVHAGSQVLPGLVRRRAAEAALFSGVA